MSSALILGVVKGVVIFLLLLFTLRRLVLIAAAARPLRTPVNGFTPTAVVLVAVRNEEASLTGLLDALERLEYPRDKLHFVLVNDSSDDATGRVLKSWTSSRPNTRYIELPQRVGKAEALNVGLKVTPETDLVAVYDVDLRPHPGSLQILAGAFRDPLVGAASGFRMPSNPGRNPVTAYGALESYVHQLVTQAGKERLGLNPTTLGGNCAYRRSALLGVGGFPPGAFSEDIEVSLALVARGWRTRFLPAAVATSRMVQSPGRYWNQRSRWTRGIYRSARRAARPESWLVSAGYADRIVFLAALTLFTTGHIAPFWPALYLLPPAAAVGFALYRSGLGPRLSAYILFWSVPMFALDIAATVAATVNALLRRRLDWPTGHPRDP